MKRVPNRRRNFREAFLFGEEHDSFAASFPILTARE
jgi:hypothetical protein